MFRTERIDGVDIKSLNLRWLRSILGMVGQEPVLFDGTVYDNIAQVGVRLALTDEALPLLGPPLPTSRGAYSDSLVVLT